MSEEWRFCFCVFMPTSVVRGSVPTVLLLLALLALLARGRLWRWLQMRR